jgi:hypothetical protein
MMAKKIVLTQEMVNRYIELDKAEKSTKRERESLRDEIIAAFQAGVECPGEGPHVLTLVKYAQKKCDWKTALFAFAKKHVGELLAIKLLKKVEDEAPEMNIEKILIKENLDYQEAS